MGNEAKRVGKTQPNQQADPNKPGTTYMPPDLRTDKPTVGKNVLQGITNLAQITNNLASHGIDISKPIPTQDKLTDEQKKAASQSFAEILSAAQSNIKKDS